jgi:hypothetical protein
MDNELDQIIAELKQDVAKIVAEGQKYFEGAIKSSGLVLSGELLSSVDSILRSEAKTIEATAIFSFNKYWRFKDMKRLNYSGYINVDAMMSFVEKVGVGKFAYVPGYENKNPSEVPIGIAKHRIVWGIIKQRRQVPVVIHDNKRRKYNKTKAAFMNVLRRRMMERLGARSLDLIKLGVTD